MELEHRCATSSLLTNGLKIQLQLLESTESLKELPQMNMMQLVLVTPPLTSQRISDNGLTNTALSSDGSRSPTNSIQPGLKL